MQGTTVSQDAILETYEDVEKLIVSVSARYQRIYGDELNDWISEGKIAFFQAYRTFDPSKGTLFSSWLYHQLIKHLGVVARRLQKRKYRNELSMDCRKLEQFRPVWMSAFSQKLVQLYDVLSEESFTIVQLLINTPDDLSELLSTCSSLCDRRWRINVCQVIQQYLQQHGWSDELIEQSFNELADVF